MMDANDEVWVEQPIAVENTRWFRAGARMVISNVERAYVVRVLDRHHMVIKRRIPAALIADETSRFRRLRKRALRARGGAGCGE